MPSKIVGSVTSALVAAGLALAVPAGSAQAAPHPLLDPANGHGHLPSGKATPHVSGGAEVSFDDERAQAADVLGSAASDAPPDATATALGCANRGSATNPRANQDCTLRRQAEEQVAVNPVDPSNVVVGQNDSRIGFNHCGFDYSLDRGVTFGDGLPPFWQAFSPLNHTFDFASDPAVTFDGTGRAWFGCVVADVASNATGLIVTRSTPALKASAFANVGQFGSPFVVDQDASGNVFFDKEFIAGDQRAGATAVYVTFTRFLAEPFCKRPGNAGGFCESPIFISKWNGTRWTTPVEISGQSPLCTLGNTFSPRFPADACNFDQGSFPVVLPSGDVFVVFNNGNTPTLVNQQLGVHVHVNGDILTADPPVKVGVDDETRLALCDFGRGPEQCVDSLNVRSNDFPTVALDPTNGSHLVAVWTDTRASVGRGNYDVVVSESTDGGAHWSDAGGGGTVLTTGGAFFFPSAAVTSPSGKVVVSMHRANTAVHAAAVGDGTFGYGFQVKGAAGFGGYLPASDSQTNPSPQANPAQAGFLGDYSSVAASPTGDVVHMVWSDTRNSNSAGPDEDVFIFTTAVH